jgi:hypothetical protein
MLTALMLTCLILTLSVAGSGPTLRCLARRDERGRTVERFVSYF